MWILLPVRGSSLHLWCILLCAWSAGGPMPDQTLMASGNAKTLVWIFSGFQFIVPKPPGENCSCILGWKWIHQSKFLDRINTALLSIHSYRSFEALEHVSHQPRPSQETSFIKRILNWSFTTEYTLHNCLSSAVKKPYRISLALLKMPSSFHPSTALRVPVYDCHFPLPSWW